MPSSGFVPATGECPVLSAQHLGALARPLCRRVRRHRRGPRARSIRAAPVRTSPRALRCSAGCVARPRRARPGVRPRARGRTVRGPACGRCPRGERDRHDVSASSDTRRAGANAFTRPAGSLHRYQHPSVARSPGERRGEQGRRRRPAVAASALGARRTGARRRTHRERTAPVRRDPQRDDRHADRAGLRAEQPRPQRGARHRGGGGVCRTRPARPLPGDPRTGRDQRRTRGRVRLSAAAHHLRPRPPSPRPRHRSQHAARQPPLRWSCRLQPAHQAGHKGIARAPAPRAAAISQGDCLSVFAFRARCSG
jgi:hypothetical protein